MRNALVVVLVAGCWTSSTKQPTPAPIANQPAPTPVAAKPEPAPPPPSTPNAAAAPPAGTGGTTYGGAVAPQGAGIASLTGSGLGDANVYGGLLGNDMGPTVVPLEPKIVRGSLDKQAVRSTVKRNLSKVKDCYTDQFFAKPMMGTGKLNVTLTIAGDGKVTNVDASGIDKDVEQCVETALATVTFPKAKNGKPTVVTYPFDLRAAEMEGGFGYGRSGFGPAGGGGTGWGTIGTGRYGKIGQGAGNYSVGSGSGKKAAVPTVSIGQPGVSDTNLDKAIIRRYVKRNIQKIQYCYEKELLNDLKLAGTVTAKFTIEADGTVTAASASGMGNTTVEDCIAKTISAIQFPNPKDNKALSVSYPFTFRPAD